MEETDELRTEFQPLIKFFMSKLYEHWEYMLTKQRHFRDPGNKEWFESIFTNWRDLNSFLCHFCALSLQLPEGFDAEQLEQLFSVLSKNWNVPLADLEASIYSFTAQVNEAIQLLFTGVFEN